MKKKLLLLMTCLIMTLGCVACGKSEPLFEEPVFVEVEDESVESLSEAEETENDSEKNDSNAQNQKDSKEAASSKEEVEQTTELDAKDQNEKQDLQQSSDAQNVNNQDNDNNQNSDSNNNQDGDEQKESNEAAIEDVATTEDNMPEAETPAKAEAGTPVANHGELSVKGTDLVDKNGKKFQIQGVSTHGIGWFPEYVNKEGFRTMRDEWGVNCVRLAMYSAEGAGYCTGGNKTQLKQIVTNGVDYATELGMYVIIDWHVLGDQDPNVHKATAKEFFQEMSAKYAKNENVIYEICNEPNGGTTWSSVKSYAEEVIPVIKANNPDAIIIVGTPTWSQDVDQAAANPIKGYNNIMYAIHFYADTHRDSLRQKMLGALKKNLPIFCTEFGICDASGSGANNKPEGEKWIATMDANNISYCIWNLSNKAETSSLIASGCNKKSGWSTNDLSDSGKWYVGILNHGVTPGSTASQYDESNDWNNSGNDSGNNNGNNNGNNSTPAVSASSSNTEATIVSSGGWDSGNVKNYQYTITIRNTSDKPIKDWSVTVDFGTNVSLDQSWNGNYKAGGSRLTVTPVDYNKEISAGQSTEVGFIISSSGNVNEPKISIN